MKKTLSLILVFMLTLSLAVGCSKKDDVEELDLGQAVEDNGEEILEVSNENEEDSNLTQEIDYIIYVRYKDKPFLYDEVFSVNINDEKFKDKSIEEFVIDELFNYESEGNYTNGIPEGTKVLGIERENNNVIINLSKEFTKKDMSNTDALLTLGTIVNTLTAIPGNETVQIKVEGEIIDNFNGVDISAPIYFMEGLYPDK